MPDPQHNEVFLCLLRSELSRPRFPMLSNRAHTAPNQIASKPTTLESQTPNSKKKDVEPPTPHSLTALRVGKKAEEEEETETSKDERRGKTSLRVVAGTYRGGLRLGAVGFCYRDHTHHSMLTDRYNAEQTEQKASPAATP